MVPEDGKVWKLLISFTKIAEMISSSSYTVGNTLILRDMIEEFFVA